MFYFSLKFAEDSIERWKTRLEEAISYPEFMEQTFPFTFALGLRAHFETQLSGPIALLSAFFNFGIFSRMIVHVTNYLMMTIKMNFNSR